MTGLPARYLPDRAITSRIEADLPWGTNIINATGAFMLGPLSGLAFAGHLSPVGKALLGVGFCAAYTTFSTFTFEQGRAGRFDSKQLLDPIHSRGHVWIIRVAVRTSGPANEPTQFPSSSDVAR